jgi:hypothetical protein
MNDTLEALTIVSVKLEDAQHRAGVARGLVMTNLYPGSDNERAAMDAIMLLFSDMDDALRAARLALNGPAEEKLPY